MKVIIIILIVCSTILSANIEITQNMKALYKNVQLSEAQENYIFDNQEIQRRILIQLLRKRISNYKILDEKNIIRFTIKPNGEISKIVFLKESGNIRLDRETKKAVKIAAERFPRPIEETEIRFIIEYEREKSINKIYNKQLEQVNHTIKI